MKQPEILTLNPVLKGAIPFMAIDPASGEEMVKRGDDTALAAAYIKWLEKTVEMYVVDVRGGRWKPDRVVDNLFNMTEMWRPRKIFIEANQAKGWLLDPIHKRAREQGIHIPYETFPSTAGKASKDRIFSLHTPYVYRNIFHADAVKNSKLEEQLLRFQPGGKEHDDYPDVLAMLWVNATKKRHRARGANRGWKVGNIHTPRYQSTGH